MEKLKYLEFDKLIKELDFIESEIKFKSELIRNIDSYFMESVTHFLDAHPHLKTIYLEQVSNNLSVSDSLVSEVVIDDKEETEEIVSDEVVGDRLRNLYRQVVKLTHPDKNKSETLNHLYSEATDSYKSGKIFTLYKICHRLNLSIEISDDELIQIKTEIKSGRERLKFLETTYPYQWWNENLESTREKIILTYIKGRLIKG